MKEKLSNLALISVGILSLVLLIFGTVEYILPPVMPFIIAWLIASATLPLAKRLKKAIHLPERALRLISSLTIGLFFLVGTGFLLWRLSLSLWHFLIDTSENNRLYELIGALLSDRSGRIGRMIPEQLVSYVKDGVESLISFGISTLPRIIGAVMSVMPRLFLFLIVTLISIAYFSFDYDRIWGFLEGNLPRRVTELLERIRLGTVRVIKKYILSYSLLMLITYFILLVGFSLLSVEHGAMVALFIAILDILPVLGVGTVLIPWSIFEIALGDRLLGFGLLVLFIVNALIRQILEPSIVGRGLDIHPLVTLMLFYVGFSLFGIAGMLLLPIAAVCIISILKEKDRTDLSKGGG